MNTHLVEYGIQNERSHLRAHVCILARSVYLYPTIAGLDRVESKHYNESATGRNGIETARGYLVQPDDIDGCSRLHIPDAWIKQLDIRESDSTATKGDKAMKIVMGLWRLGLLSIAQTWIDVCDRAEQIEGADVILRAEARIQVKCDYRGGHKESGGTGNLFIQIAECNPENEH